ncbi:DUF4136 domain-containing protein [Reichenbachiella ulvae]|uniref:DUF4136 domain-containing protein n=1 Tax=Reichenbachiella ulvae TaxID=2980104 RepID=A0ABT3CWK1_9BACT|nr:DUF4136 domain-containing protein [Reichenbachiella ulvae]MCV9388092.1 DUF4136 domain-containing protein [Reichenbachiella ulvae]
MKKRAILLGVMVVLFTSCSSLKIATDQKSGVDFSSFTTYALDIEYDGEQNEFFNEINIGRFEEAFTQGLTQRGLVEMEENPEVRIKVTGNMDVLKNYSTTQNSYGTMGRGRYYSGGVATSDTREYESLVGKLIVSIVDPETEELLWYSSISTGIADNPQSAQKSMSKLVDRLMVVFPIYPERSDDLIL